MLCRHMIWGVSLSLFCTAISLRADIPRLISYQGILADAAGAPVQNGEYPMTFQLFDTVAGGTSLWLENRPVATFNGVFDILLGELSPLNLAFDRAYYLQTVFGGNVLAPRTLFSATAYSLNIADSVAVRSINGLQDDLFIRADEGIVIASIGDTMRISANIGMISTDISGATSDITANWSSYADCIATVNCSGPGIVICESVVQLQVSHTTGTADRIQLCHAATPGNAGPDVAYFSVHSVPAEYPTFLNNEITVPVRTVFEITIAGDYTYYLNGRATQGQGGDRFWYASLTATFHPRHSIDALPTLDGRPATIEKLSR